MRHLILGFLVAAATSAAPGTNTFTGVITDNMCAMGGHADMHMGPTDADCTDACVSIHGALYVLLDGKDVYSLSDQKLPQKFSAQKVRVTGTLDAKTKTIHVESMTAVK